MSISVYDNTALPDLVILKVDRSNSQYFSMGRHLVTHARGTCSVSGYTNPCGECWRKYKTLWVGYVKT